MGEALAMKKKHAKPDFVLHRAPRTKTIGLRVERDGTVVIRAPQATSRAFIRAFLRKKRGWIQHKRDYFADLRKRFPPKEFKNGESFPVLGRNYRLKIVRVRGLKKQRCATEGKRLRVFVNGHTGLQLKAAIADSLRFWYSARTEMKARTVIERHGPALEVSPTRLQVVDQAMRWASCSKSGSIRLNWRLSMLPAAILEYIVVHELCHLRIHDHSPRFWRLLQSVLPDFEKRRAWLRQNGSSHGAVNWPTSKIKAPEGISRQD